MKKVVFLLISVILISCQNNKNHKSNEYSKDNLCIHFQGGFKADTVKVYIDKNIVLDEVLLTDRGLGFAKEYCCKLDDVEKDIEIVMFRNGNEYRINIGREELILQPKVVSFLGVYFSKGKLYFYTMDKMHKYM